MANPTCWAVQQRLPYLAVSDVQAEIESMFSPDKESHRNDTLGDARQASMAVPLLTARRGCTQQPTRRRAWPGRELHGTPRGSSGHSVSHQTDRRVASGI